MKVVAVSGPSCSGKTTLVKYLHQILPDAHTIFEDDFYLPDSEIPKTNGLENWDCPEAFDLAKMAQTLSHARENGTLPPEHKSIEAANAMGPVRPSPEVVARLKDRVQHIKEPVVLVDGIMLFHKSSPVLDEFDHKIVLFTDYATLKQRRESRSGYVTIEGFWQDPPGYFDDIVWPEYLKNYGFLYEGEPGTELSKAARQQAIVAPPSRELDALLTWAVDLILE
ncbi:Nicotinamide riboside kinase [Wickerhamiella sorbophila]|uniref:Nicotinamide riboside kinase n=1 Tax=Wickerhamiella sorbophila TaxID=45607 RepID=A0A2T0FH96_9ASCO|nr:Nicotinamide riboside kinase [Wickerhamiella sorbophila]PRT54365.1 Nicotinamide riboside kinase [Wickerhamiella sorbophila]